MGDIKRPEEVIFSESSTERVLDAIRKVPELGCQGKGNVLLGFCNDLGLV